MAGTTGHSTLLTAQHIALVKSSFALFGDSKSLKHHGVNLMLSLFKTDPELQDMFPMFKGKSAKELEACHDMQAHGATVMYQLRTFVDNIDDLDCVVALMQKVARSHTNRGVKFEEFEKVRKMFGSFLKQELGGKATPEIISAWDAMLSKVNGALKAH